MPHEPVDTGQTTPRFAAQAKLRRATSAEDDDHQADREIITVSDSDERRDGDRAQKRGQNVENREQARLPRPVDDFGRAPPRVNATTSASLASGEPCCARSRRSRPPGASPSPKSVRMQIFAAGREVALDTAPPDPRVLYAVGACPFATARLIARTLRAGFLDEVVGARGVEQLGRDDRLALLIAAHVDPCSTKSRGWHARSRACAARIVLFR